MKNWLHKLCVGLLCCAIFVFGWHNRVLAEEITSNSTPILKAQLAQLEVSQNVYDYLLRYQPETYNTIRVGGQCPPY
ncbi:hypothetical protein [Trichormus variabilis]|uniref:Uncharacterized protein n=1 Tax=Trichormus variabilis SAG 1403-4b TaxID=447716 RepID=A0A433USK6_ANAVA|nr:hypothetical protein [Trichormus variabilis]RUS96828.1 hypothetical protein DSM107003_22340 [Trichormus variabilis SAG 1403-4b]